MDHTVFEQIIRVANELEEVQNSINDVVKDYNDHGSGINEVATIESLHTLSYFEMYTFKVIFKFFTDSVQLEDKEFVSEAKVIVNMTNNDGSKNETKSVSVTDESIHSLDAVALGIILKMFAI